MGSTPLKCIREKCIDCSGGSYKEVELCTVEECPLHPYRFGKRPATVKRKQAEQRKEKTA